MERPYHRVGKADSQELAKLLAKGGQALLPMVERTEESKLAVDELIDVLGERRSKQCCGCRPKGSRGLRIQGRSGRARASLK